MLNSRFKIVISVVVLCFCSMITPMQASAEMNNDPVLEVKLYPNPATDHFSITIVQSSRENTREVKSITVDNIVGKEVKRFAANSENKYSIAGLKRGMYIVRVFDDKDRMIKALRLSKN